MRIEKKQKLGQLRRWRIRKKVVGTKDRPRMSVFFSNKNITVQFIDDITGATLAAATTIARKAERNSKPAANVTSAKTIGAKAAEAAQSKGITQVVFDRGTARYHGKVKALADAAREAGLKF